MLGPILLALNDASTVYVPVGAARAERRPGRVPAGAPLADRCRARRSRVRSTATTPAVYRVFQKTDDRRRPGRALSGQRPGAPVYLVDPGINGTHRVRPDGTQVNKFAAPKATLMSYIIKGILNQQLPWTLVILGGMIAVILEMCGIGSLAFAVGRLSAAVVVHARSSSAAWSAGWSTGISQGASRAPISPRPR